MSVIRFLSSTESHPFECQEAQPCSGADGREAPCRIELPRRPPHTSTLGHMSTITRIGIFVLVFAAGGGLGTYLGFRIAGGKAFADEMAQVAHYSAYLDAQLAKGNDAAYEEALRGYLALLDMRSRSASPMFSEKVYAVDTALTYARLSVLASKRGANDEAAAYLTKASALCPKLGWEDCSAATITQVAGRLDKRSTIGSSKTQ